MQDYVIAVNLYSKSSFVKTIHGIVLLRILLNFIQIKHVSLLLKGTTDRRCKSLQQYINAT